MTHLRKITLEELERRNYSETTTRSYLHTIEDFARHFNRPPDQLGLEEIREFTAHMFRVRKLADNTVGQRVAALRFFFTKTLKRSWNIEETPYPKRRTQLPVILSQDEVARLIDAASNPFHHAILMTLYGTGVRRADLTRLKITDIDSQRIVFMFREARGAKIAISCSARTCWPRCERRLQYSTTAIQSPKPHRCYGHLWRWLILSARRAMHSSRAVESG